MSGLRYTALYVPTGPGDQTISPSGIASAEAFGTPRLDQRIAASGIGPAEALGAPRVDLHIAATGIASAEAVGTARLDQHVTVSGIGSAENLGTPSVSHVGTQTVSPAAIASGEAIGSARVEADWIYVGGTVGDGTSNYSVSLDGTLTGGVASSPAAGDLVVVISAFGNTASSAPAVSGNNTGAYTGVGTAIHSNDTWDTEAQPFYAVMGATPDTSLSVTRTNNASYGGVTVVQVWRGVHRAAPYINVAQTSGGNGAAANPPSHDPGVTGALIFAAGAGTFASTEATGYTGFTGMLHSRAHKGDGSTSDTSAVLAALPYAGSAYDPPVASGGTQNNASSSWAAYTFSFRTRTHVSVAPSAIATAEAFGNATVSGTAPAQTITASAIASAESLGAPQVNLSVAVSGIGSTETVGTARLDLRIEAASVASAEAFGAATIQAVAPAQEIAPSAISSAESFGAAVVAMEGGDQAIVVGSIAGAEAFGTPALGLYVDPVGIASEGAVSTPRLDLLVIPGSIPSGEVLGTLEITGGALVHASRLGATITLRPAVGGMASMSAAVAAGAIRATTAVDATIDVSAALAATHRLTPTVSGQIDLVE